MLARGGVSSLERSRSDTVNQVGPSALRERLKGVEINYGVMSKQNANTGWLAE